MDKMNQISDKELDKIKMAFEDEDDDNDRYKGSKKPTDPKSKTPILDSFSRDLTKMATEGRIDPVVGREKEIERVSQILSRRKKNNPILLGEPGCVDENTIIVVKKVSDQNSHEIINI